MRRIYLTSLLTIALVAFRGGYAQAQTDVTWEDYTSHLTNPSFEAATAASNLTTTNWFTETGWILSPSTAPANSQAGIGNSSSTIQGIASSFTASDGNNYMYIRCNWNSSTTYSISQAVSSLPVGLYKVSCKVAVSSSSITSSTFTLSLSDGTNTSSNTSAYSKEWTDWSIIFYKKDASTDLTITASMNPGSQGGSQHYCLLLDDFKLKYLSDDNLDNVSSTNTLNLSDAITNRSIYNVGETKVMPKGWTASANTKGNDHYTEKGTSDTQLEGWSNNTMNIDYNQTLSNLPNGKYTVSAKCHDSNDTGASLYASSGENTVNADMGKDYATLTTGEILVSNNTLKIGIIGSNISGTWMTGDDFAVTYLGPDYSAAYNQALDAAKAASANTTDYINIPDNAEERSALTTAISTYGNVSSDYQTATDALTKATNALTSAKANYDALATAKTTADPNLEYASSAAKEEFATAKDVTATSASDADAKTAAITTALRAYYESNAKAEGITGATEVYTYNFTDKTASYPNVGTKNGENVSSDWTGTQGGGNFKVLSSESWTDSKGNASYGYFDYWNGDHNSQHLTHKITLPEGKYILTVKARAQTGALTYLKAAGKQISLEANGNTGGVFNRGWDDYTLEFTTPAGDVTLEWYSDGGSGNNKRAVWTSFGDVRLYKIADLETVTLNQDETEAVTTTTDYVNVYLNRTFKQGWNSVVLPFATTAEALGAAEAAEYKGTDGNTIKFETTTTLAANTPYLVHFAADQTEAKVINGVKIAPADEPKVSDTNNQYDFVGTYTALAKDNETIKGGDYIVVSGGIQKAKGGNALKAFRAYFKANSTESAAKSMVISIDGNAVSTGINAVNAGSVNDGNVYNVAGQKVSGSYKGLVIKNGKKYLRK